MNEQLLNLLVVDSDMTAVNHIRDLLEHAKYKVHFNYVTRLSDAITFMMTDDVDLVLLELDLEDSTGIETFNRVYSEFDVPIVVMVESDNESTAVMVLRHGAQDLLVKNGVLNSRGLKRTIVHTIERCAFIKNNLENERSVNLDAFAEARQVLRESTKSLREASIRIPYGNEKTVHQLTGR